MDDAAVEHEICANCKREIPHYNYVMHTAHCARNFSLCQVCKEPVSKNEMETHRRQKHTTDVRRIDEKLDFPKHHVPTQQRPMSHTLNGYAVGQPTGQSSYNSALRQTTYGNTTRQSVTDSSVVEAAAAVSKPKTSASSLLACKYCELELPKLDLEAHENYCGARTDRCNECGEIVMFKYKKLHEDTNHGFVKLSDEPGPRATWDSNTQRSAPPETPSYLRRQRPEPIYTVDSFDFTPLYNAYGNYSSSSLAGESANGEKRETYRDISRRLDCQAPLPPHRRPNPPTELTIPCEFCQTPIPHEDLIQHESGCRPDLARFNPRRRSSPSSDDDYFVAPPPPGSPDVELPCEFCADMFPASELLRHQLTCV